MYWQILHHSLPTSEISTSNLYQATSPLVTRSRIWAPSVPSPEMSSKISTKRPPTSNRLVPSRMSSHKQSSKDVESTKRSIRKEHESTFSNLGLVLIGVIIASANQSKEIANKSLTISKQDVKAALGRDCIDFAISQIRLVCLDLSNGTKV